MLIYLILLPLAGWWWTYRQLSRERSRNDVLQQRVLTNLVSPAYLSHEIRTPLTVIKGAAEILTDGDLGPISPAQRQFLETIAENSATACALAEDFLVLFSMEKSLAQLHLVKTDVRQLMREAVHEFRIMHACDIRLNNHGAPVFVDADPRMLKQVVWNLLTNSVRHGGEGTHIVMRVSADDGIALIVVEDTGIGLLSSAAADDDPVRVSVGDLPQSGSGIGMKVVEHIISAHRGTLVVDATLGFGTQVYIQLPVRGLG